MQDKIPLQHIGNDVAGVVREVGELVTWVNAGDEVMLQPGVSCGHCGECLAGRDNMCRDYDIIGSRRDGGYAELVAVPGINVIPKPKNLSWEEAAALPLVTLTAWHMLVARADVHCELFWCTRRRGVGSVVIQIANSARARDHDRGSEEKWRKRASSAPMKPLTTPEKIGRKKCAG